MDLKNKEESHAAFNANGTGPILMTNRQPGIKSSFKRNPARWGEWRGNVQAVDYAPIGNDATRFAALVSG